MKDYKSLIADIRTEACELADKLKRLEVFMMSEDFCKISPEQKSLLETQYDLMAKYKVTLVKRAHRINYEHCILTTKDEPALEKAPDTTDGPEVENKPDADTSSEEKETRLCYNCKHGTRHIGPGTLSYSCNSAVQCCEGSRWEER